MAYMCFFVANSPLGVSGVIAVVVMGLQGSSCGKWDMSAKILETGQFDHFWDIISFAMNGIVFFFAGVASLNFMLRSGGVIYSLGFWPLLQFFSLTPAIYLAIFLVRIVGMMMVKPILSLLGSPLTGHSASSLSRT
uniref:Salt overly sensitive 1 n=1 Tax=Tetraselmis sp. GSL018 TaxID=582737 RepID=A0A061QQL4_9CHLO